MEHRVCTREVRIPEDSEFLLSLYASTRERDLALFGFTGAEAGAFVRMQFSAQDLHYRKHYPTATHTVITLGDALAGRVVLDRSGGEILVVDLALLPAFRRAGLGTAVVRRLIDEADATGRLIRCHVEQDNEARGFWERLGFGARGVDGVHVVMERACETSHR